MRARAPAGGVLRGASAGRKAEPGKVVPAAAGAQHHPGTAPSGLDFARSVVELGESGDHHEVDPDDEHIAEHAGIELGAGDNPPRRGSESPAIIGKALRRWHVRTSNGEYAAAIPQSGVPTTTTISASNRRNRAMET